MHAQKEQPTQRAEMRARAVHPSEPQAEKAKESTRKPGEDHAVGLRTAKVSDYGSELSDEQKIVREYFDNDYFEVTEYEYMNRYPQIYQDAKVTMRLSIESEISYSQEETVLLGWLRQDEALFSYRGSNGDREYSNYLKTVADQYVLIKIPTQTIDMRIVKGDWINVWGTYTGLETAEIEGESKILPTVEVQQTIVAQYFDAAQCFDEKFVTKVAKILFGEDAQVREPVAGVDYEPIQRDYDNPYLLCEVKNQSGENLQYRLYLKLGHIEDARYETYYDYDSITSDLEFSEDLQAFHIFIYDTEKGNCLLECFDRDLNTKWTREFAFEGMNIGTYDYTDSNIYLAANNDIYIINTETGEDRYPAQFVGEKTDVRKLEDGVLLLNTGKTDAFMMLNLDGTILWKQNAHHDISQYTAIQVVNDKIVLPVYDSDPWQDRVYILNPSDGTIELDAEKLTPEYYDSSDYGDQEDSYDAGSGDPGDTGDMPDSDFDQGNAQSQDYYVYDSEEGMVFPYSSYLVVTEDDVIAAINYNPDSTVSDVLGFARNEIYARHGHLFNSGGKYDKYYNQFDWYRVLPKREVDFSEFNSVEQANINYFKAIEKELK